MNAAVDPNIYTDNRGLAGLRAAARSGENQEETLRKVAGQFESIFINQVLKTMRDATLGDDIMGSDQTKFYQSMFDQQMSQEITRGQGLGLAELLVRQLSPASGVDSNKHSPEAAMPLDRHDQLSYAVPRTAKISEKPESSASMELSMQPSVQVDQLHDWQPENRQAFVRDLWPHAEKAADALGTKPEYIVAQAALESGWGQHQMKFGSGRSAHNLFGIKADSRWSGPRVSHQTLEFHGGVMQQERAAFRAYHSAADSVQDYVDFIKTNPRYQKALDSGGDGQEYIREIHRAGYATDPEYLSKISSIVKSEPFQNALTQLKAQSDRPLNSVAEFSARERLDQNQTTAPVRGGEV